MKDRNVYDSIMTGLKEALADAQKEDPCMKRQAITVGSVDAREKNTPNNTTSVPPAYR